MFTYMRNKETGEIRPVEPESAEFYSLQKEVQGNGQTRWEQTHLHHADAVEARRQAGALDEADLGAVDQPTPLTKDSPEGVNPDIHPETALTEGEKAMGLESYEQKLEQLSGHPGEPATALIPGDTVHEDAGKVNADDPDAEAARRAAPTDGGLTSEKDGDDSDGDTELRGQALDDALEERDLSKSGTVAEKRQRLADYESENDSEENEVGAGAGSGS